MSSHRFHFDIYRDGARVNSEDEPYVITAPSIDEATVKAAQLPQAQNGVVVVLPSSPGLAPPLSGRSAKDWDVIYDYLRAHDFDSEADYLKRSVETAVHYQQRSEDQSNRLHTMEGRLRELLEFLREVFGRDSEYDDDGALSGDLIETSRHFSMLMDALRDEARAGACWNSVWMTHLSSHVRGVTRFLSRLSCTQSYAGERPGELYEAIRRLNYAMTIQNAKPIQMRVDDWVRDCFGHDVAEHRGERVSRFMEEALELAQASGEFTAAHAHQMVDYVFSRPKGEVPQEIAGVAITLMALANAWRQDVGQVSQAELIRCEAYTKDIRDKQFTKPAIGLTPRRYQEYRKPWGDKP